MKLYHSTSATGAAGIDNSGFFERSFGGIASGVFLSDRPLTDADGVAKSCEVCFEVDLPGWFDLAPYELIGDDRPQGAYREWIVPIDFANSWPRVRMAQEYNE